MWYLPPAWKPAIRNEKSKARAMAASCRPKRLRPHLGRRDHSHEQLEPRDRFQARHGIMSERTRALFSYTISSIEKREVTFRRRGHMVALKKTDGSGGVDHQCRDRAGHPAWLADGARVSSTFAARANTRPIITTAGPAAAAAARRSGKSAIVAAMTVSSARVALITATAGVAASRPAAIAAAANAACVFTGM